MGELGPADTDALAVVDQAIDLLDRGEARVAEVDPARGEVVVHSWLKTAILLLFRLRAMETTEVGPFEFHDKLPLKTDYAAAGVRVVPGASARWGSFLDRGVILMPSYVNIGARVGADTMVDTWATVGSCAQIGARVHLAGGVGIGGVLEPPERGARHGGRRRQHREPVHGDPGGPGGRGGGAGRGSDPEPLHSRHRRRDGRGARSGGGARPGASRSARRAGGSIPGASSSCPACSSSSASSPGERHDKAQLEAALREHQVGP